MAFEQVFIFFAMKVLIINGPNLNHIGEREPEIYGHASFDDYLEELRQKYAVHHIMYFQSNVEGCIIDKIQQACREEGVEGIIINCGGYSHTSVAVADAIAGAKIPVVEVHISNVFNREPYRQNLITAAKCTGFVSGLGLQSYDVAMYAILTTGR